MSNKLQDYFESHYPNAFTLLHEKLPEFEWGFRWFGLVHGFVGKSGDIEIEIRDTSDGFYSSRVTIGDTTVDPQIHQLGSSRMYPLLSAIYAVKDHLARQRLGDGRPKDPLL